VVLATLAVALALRLFHLDAPLIGEHSWRQTDTASMARHFERGGYRFLRPQVQWGGDGSGEIASELPLYPFLVALLQGVLGPHDWIGRLLAAVFSVASIAYLYALARVYAGERSARWAAFFLAVLPLSVFFGRAVMGESLMLAASVGGIFHFSQWTRTGSRRDFAASALLTAIACGVKATALFAVFPLGWLAFSRFGLGALRKSALWLYAALVLGPLAAWYAHAHAIEAQTGLTVGIFGKLGDLDLVLRSAYWKRVVFDRFAQHQLTWLGFGVFAVGLVLPRRRPGERLFDVWLLGMLVYLVVVAPGNHLHSYYLLPLLYPAAVTMARVYDRWFEPATLALGAVALGILVWSALLLRILYAREDPATSPDFALATRVAAATRPDERVVLADRDPTVLYLADRHGWTDAIGVLDDAALEDRIARGAALLAGSRDHRGWSAAQDERVAALARRYTPLGDDRNGFVIRLAR
jgi:4-amino-4-deoxy-L-arabinose transferase-like glycosyltransferase